MTTHVYKGVTAYIQNTNEMNLKLSILSEAIFQLHPFIGVNTFDLSDHQAIIRSESFQFIRKNDHLLTNREMHFPEHTPKAYQSLDVETVTIKGQDLVRLYLPVISEDAEKVDFMVEESLLHILDQLFGRDLVAVKAKVGTNTDAFDGLTEDVLLSAERFAQIA